MSVEGLAQARRDREDRDAAADATRERMARRMAWMRRLVLFPCLVAALWLLWYIGFEYARITCLPIR